MSSIFHMNTRLDKWSASAWICSWGNVKLWISTK